MKQDVESAPVNSEGELSNKIETAAQIVQDKFIVYEIDAGETRESHEKACAGVCYVLRLRKFWVKKGFYFIFLQSVAFLVK